MVNTSGFIDKAELDRVGCFKYSPVEGAKANELPDPVPEDVQEARFQRFMELQQQVSVRKLARKVGKEMTVLIDEVDEEGATGRSFADAPEIDGLVYLNGETGLKPGDMVKVRIDEADEYDLWASKATASGCARAQPQKPVSPADWLFYWLCPNYVLHRAP